MHYTRFRWLLGEGRCSMSVRFRVLFSTACAVLAVMVCLNYAQHVQAEADRARSEVLARYGGEVVTLVVSSAALEPGDIATQSNVTTREWLVDLAPEGALTSLDEVLGKEVGNAAPKGVPLTDVTFRDASTMAEVPAGRVAVTVPVTDRLGVPRDISQGATLAAYEVSGEGTSLICASMSVLAAPAQTSLGATPQLTLAVLPEDVPAILAASASSDLRLVMPGTSVAQDEEGMADPAAPEEVKADESEERSSAS